MRAEQTDASRVLEIGMRGRILMRLPWTHDFNVSGAARITEMVEAGVEITNPVMRLGIGTARAFSTLEDMGCLPSGETNVLDPDAMLRVVQNGWFWYVGE